MSGNGDTGNQSDVVSIPDESDLESSLTALIRQHQDKTSATVDDDDVKLVLALGTMALDRYEFSLGRNAFLYALAHIPRHDHGTHVDVWLGLARVALGQGIPREAFEALAMAESYLRRASDPRREAELRFRSASLLRSSAVVHQAIVESRQAMELAGQIGDDALRAASEVVLGSSLAMGGALGEAETWLQSGLASARRIGDRWTQYDALRNLADLARVRGQAMLAEQWSSEAVAIYGPDSTLIEEAESYAVWAALSEAVGDTRRAEHLRQLASLKARIAGISPEAIMGQGSWAIAVSETVRHEHAFSLDDLHKDELARWADLFRFRAFRLADEGNEEEARTALGAADRLAEMAGVRRELDPSRERVLAPLTAPPRHPAYHRGWSQPTKVIAQVAPPAKLPPTEQEIYDFLDRQSRYKSLTPALKKLLARSAAGIASNKVAKPLPLTAGTVRTYRNLIRDKLGLDHYAQAPVEVYRDMIATGTW